MKKEVEIADWFFQREGSKLYLCGYVHNSPNPHIKAGPIIRLDFETHTVETEHTIYKLLNPMGM